VPIDIDHLDADPDLDPLLVEVPEEVRTERLVIRALTLDDAHALFASIDASRDTLRPWMPWEAGVESDTDSRMTITRFIANRALRKDLPYGIFDAATGDHLGGTGLHRMDWRLRSFEIGYWLRSSAVGHGYVTETALALTRMAFEQLAARRVEIRLDPSNARSRAVPERLGFRLEGTLRDSLLDHNGEVRSTDVFSLVRGDELPW
jgi:RimJ/RimL family protein N-acetyltransferase